MTEELPDVRAPAPDYSATARRHAWVDLPGAVRRRLAAFAGGRVDGVRPAGGGFTHGFAGLVDGRRTVFAKAIAVDDEHVYPGYAREARVLSALPSGLPVPRLLAVERVPVAPPAVDWILLVFEAVEGTMPGRPWTLSDARAIHDSCLETNAALSGNARILRDLRPGPLAEEWTRDTPHLALAERWVADPSARPLFLPRWFAPDGSADGPPGAAADLLRLAARGPRALVGDTPLNNDLRADNVVIAASSAAGHPAGTAWICDWNWLSVGPAWADWAALFPYLHDAGLPWGTILGWELTRDADPDDVDSWLALLGLYMADAGSRPELATSPRLRAHGRFTARITLELLAARRGWAG